MNSSVNLSDALIPRLLEGTHNKKQFFELLATLIFYNKVKYQDTTNLDTITIMKIEKITTEVIIILLLDLSRLDNTLQREMLTTITITTTITIETTIAMADNRTTDQPTRDNLNHNSRITIIDSLLLSLLSLVTLANSSLAPLDRL